MTLRDVAAPLALAVIFSVLRVAGVSEATALPLACGPALALQVWLRMAGAMHPQDGTVVTAALAILVLSVAAAVTGEPEPVWLMYGLSAYLAVRLARALSEVRIAAIAHALPPRRRRAFVRAQTASFALAASLVLAAQGDPAVWVGGAILLRLVLHPVHWIAMRASARGGA